MLRISPAKKKTSLELLLRFSTVMPSVWKHQVAPLKKYSSPAFVHHERLAGKLNWAKNSAPTTGNLNSLFSFSCPLFVALPMMRVNLHQDRKTSVQSTISHSCLNAANSCAKSWLERKFNAIWTTFHPHATTSQRNTATPLQSEDSKC